MHDNEKQNRILAHRQKWQDRQNNSRKAVTLRQQARSRRTAQEQLDLLDDRLGVGIGAKRERKRLKKMLQQ